MRLVFFDDRFHETHGAQENLMLLATLSQDAGNDVVFVTTGTGALASKAQARGLNVQIVEAPEELKRFERTVFSGGPRSWMRLGRSLLSYNLRLAKALGDPKPDIIVSGAIRPTLLLAASRIRRRSPILLYAQNSTPMGIVAVAAGVLSSRICLISEGARSTFPAGFQRVAWKRFVSISSGRDFDRYDRLSVVDEESRCAQGRAPSIGGPGSVHVITVSSITRRKAINRLVAAMQDLHREGADVTLTIVGGTVGADSQNHLTELQDLVAGAELPVDFMGWQDDVVPFLQRSDLFAMASEHEGLPGVLLEAMAVGLPCISTSAGSAGQLIEDCESGASVEVNNHEQLVVELRRFCSDPELRRQSGLNGYGAVRTRYGLAQFHDKFQAVLDEVRGDGRG